jgi:hypothetical protein
MAVMALLCALACGGDDDGTGSERIDAALSDAAAARSDGAPPIDAAGAFVCGDETCDESAQYCYQVQAGARAGGVRRGCNGLPMQCDTAVTCACVLDHIQPACAGTITCDDTGGRVTVICGLP